MPADIRSFFGGGGVPKATEATSNSSKKSSKPAKQRARKVVSDDDEEIENVKPKVTPTKPKKPAKVEKLEETTSSAYFATNGRAKASKSTPIRTKPQPPTNDSSFTPSKSINGSAVRTSARKTPSKNYNEDDDSDENLVTTLKKEDEEADDIFAGDFKKSGRKGDDYQECSDDNVVLKPKSRPSNMLVEAPKNGTLKQMDTDDDDDIVMAEIPAYNGGADSTQRRAAKPKPVARKRKSVDFEDDASVLDDEDEAPKKKARKSSTMKAAPKSRRGSKKEEREESKGIQDIFDNIPTVRAPTPPPRGENGKFDFRTAMNNAKAAPLAAGSKEIPVGEENCLAGLTFVFTGVLESLEREEGQSLVKRYGGRCTGAPSKNTSYVVLGDEAGPKKLETIANLGIKTINEDGLFELIRRLPANGGDGKAAAKNAEKKAELEQMIKKAAQDMKSKEIAEAKEAAKIEKAAATARREAGLQTTRSPKSVDPNTKLWVDKYAPDSISAICGNKTTVTNLQNWLRAWHDNAKWDFKKAGKEGHGIYRAAMLHGPPGIGKTTAAHLVAKLEGYDVVETNASDTRSKKLVESGLKGILDTTSLLGYFAGDGKDVNADKKKLVLIMDEVDGMSAGDRGGVGALASVAKKTNIPLILICNERRLPKMKPFDHVTADFTFRRPSVEMIRGRIMTICYREGLKIPPLILDQLIEGSHGDIRQIINMISTVKLDSKNLDFNDSKAMARAWEKHVILKPWDITAKILRPQLYAASSTATLNEKIELYFNDHEFAFLMLQENYLKTVPANASTYASRPKEYNLKKLELAESAASSISDGDLVDRMIHGSQQQWSLMPTHAVFSFVRPASFMNGNFNERTGFASWLGQNSKYGKLSRFVKEIQGHMRLRASGDRHEIRQQYLPLIWQKTVAALRDEGKEAVPEVIDFMDSYYLTKDDFDSINELGVGPMDMDNVKLATQTKTTFTRVYNQQSHPMPFLKASSVGDFAKLSAKKEKPDLEEAIDEDDGDLEIEPTKEEEDEFDLKTDKYVKAAKKRPPKAAPKRKSKGKGKGKGKAGKSDDEEDDSEDGGVKVEDDGEEDVKPAKKQGTVRGGGGVRGRSRGRA